MQPSARHPHLLILSACLLGLLSTVGASLPYPLLPPLFAASSGNALSHFMGLPPKLLFGLAIAVNPLGLMLGSALLGPLSDRYGRRPVLLATALVCAVGHAATAVALLAQSYPLFVLARLVAGLAEGNTPVARAMLADRLEGDLRVRGFALLNSAIYMGWLVGPLLAGLTLGLGQTVPFWIAMASLLTTAAMVAIVVPRTTAAPAGQPWWQQAYRHHAFNLLAHRELHALFGIQLAFTLGVTAFYEFYPVWLVEFAHMDAQGIAWVTAVSCAVMTTASWLASRLGRGEPLVRARLYAGLSALAFACVALGTPVGGRIAIVAACLPISLYSAVIPAYCADRFGHHGQGAVMGLLNAIHCLSNITVAVLGSVIALLDTRLVLLAGGASALVAAQLLRRWQHGQAGAGHGIMQANTL